MVVQTIKASKAPKPLEPFMMSMVDKSKTPAAYDAFAESWARERSKPSRNSVFFWSWLQKTIERYRKAGIVFSTERPFRVLDAGCGEGRNAFELEARLRALGVPCQVTGCDVSSELIALARQTALERTSHVEFEQCGMAALRFGNDSFDFILCQAAFHHLIDPAAQVRAAREFARVLTPEGGLWMSVYNYQAKRLETPSQMARDTGRYPVVNVPWRTPEGNAFDRWYYLFKPNELRSLVENAGFSIVDSYLENAGERMTDEKTSYNFVVEASRK